MASWLRSVIADLRIPSQHDPLNCKANATGSTVSKATWRVQGKCHWGWKVYEQAVALKSMLLTASLLATCIAH